jgi:hypothetical protein
MGRTCGACQQALQQPIEDRITHAGKGFNKSDTELVGDFGHPGLEIVLEEVLEFTGKLDTSRATADNNHVQKTLALFGALVLESGGFTAVHDTLTDTLSISNLLQEARVLADTRDTLSEHVSIIF